MDWKKQNKFTTWSIIFLVVVNIITISTMWFFLTKERGPQPFDQLKRPQGSMELMQKELNLSKEQKENFEKARVASFEKSKKLLDKMNELKEKLSKELVNDNIDSTVVTSLVQEIGSTHAKLEKLRFDHFKELLSLCSKEQKEKFKPILEKLVGAMPSMPRKDMDDKRGFKNDGELPPPMPMDDGKPKPFEGPGPGGM
jgi:periplasmic protein CpxP/Spy